MTRPNAYLLTIGLLVFAALERYLGVPEAAGEMAMLSRLPIKGVKTQRTGASWPKVPVDVHEPCPGPGT